MATHFGKEEKKKWRINGSNCVVRHGQISWVFLIRIENTSDEEISVSSTIYLLSTVAKELFSVASYSPIKEYAKDCVAVLSKLNDKTKVTLHRINYRTSNGINYQLEDLCSEQDTENMMEIKTNNA